MYMYIRSIFSTYVLFSPKCDGKIIHLKLRRVRIQAILEITDSLVNNDFVSG